MSLRIDTAISGVAAAASMATTCAQKNYGTLAHYLYRKSLKCFMARGSCGRQYYQPGLQRLDLASACQQFAKMRVPWKGIVQLGILSSMESRIHISFGVRNEIVFVVSHAVNQRGLRQRSQIAVTESPVAASSGGQRTGSVCDACLSPSSARLDIVADFWETLIAAY